jgi:MFS family permease
MHPRAIWAIGCGQLVNWGVLYFAFGVLLVPLEQFLGAPRSLIAGAFSLGLLVSAIDAPAVGRLADRGQGPAVMQAGGLLAAGLLIGWAAAPSIISTYIAWALLGLCMAAILYEPVFAMVGRAFSDSDERMRAIATVTVMGGLASTVFLPGTSAIANRVGWRAAAIALAVLVGVTTLIVGRIAFRDRDWSAATIREAILDRSPRRGHASPMPDLNRYALIFAISSIVNSAIASNMVAALIDRGFAATNAALIGGSFGIMQLPGRMLMTNRAFSPGPIALIVFSFALQIAGLLALLINGGIAATAGVMIFAGGAGLTTLARPYWVLHRFGPERAGEANGIIARYQQVARAAGPVSAAALADSTGYGVVFVVLAVLLAVATTLAGSATRGSAALDAASRGRIAT